MSGVEAKAEDGALSQASESSIDPYASRIVKRTRYGIWDAYEEAEPDGGQITLKERWRTIVEAASDLERALRDLLAIPGCEALISIYTAAELAASFVPAASVWWVSEWLCFSSVTHDVVPIQAPRAVSAGRTCNSRVLLGCPIADL